MPILWHDGLRRHGNALSLARVHDHRGDGGMIIAGWPSAELTPQTVLAMHGLGRKVVGPIEGHAQLMAQNPKMRQQVVLFTLLKDLEKHGIEVAWCKGIAQRADLIVTGHVLHVEEGGGVSIPFALLQPALVFQKGRRLGEKDAKGAQGSIVEGISGVGTLFALVRQMSKATVQEALEGLEASRGRHDYLLRVAERDTLAIAASIGNFEPFTRQNENCCPQRRFS